MDDEAAFILEVEFTRFDDSTLCSKKNSTRVTHLFKVTVSSRDVYLVKCVGMNSEKFEKSDGDAMRE
jgi:hypothetical protein